MKRLVTWTDTARDELFEILVYIAIDNLSAGERAAAKIEQVAQDLSTFATSRAGRVTTIYEKPVPGLPYILVYKITEAPQDGQIIEILHGIHMARDWPPGT